MYTGMEIIQLLYQVVKHIKPQGKCRRRNRKDWHKNNVALYFAFEQLKKKLSAEGLFDEADVEPIKAVISSEGENAEIFKKYVETVNFLKEHYLKEDVNTQEEKVDIPHQLELLLKRIDGELKNKKRSEYYVYSK